MKSMANIAQNEFQQLFDHVLMRLHREAMTARDIEDMLRFLRILHDTMVEQMAEEHATASAGRRAFTDNDALAWEAKFQGLLAAFDAAVNAIDRMQHAGYAIDGAAEFRQTDLELRGMLSVPVAQLARAAENIRQGRGRPLSEVRDALRRRLHA
jgi:hypothetical protein